MSVPKYETSVTVSAAFSYVTPLWARSRSYSSANFCTCTASKGDSTSAARMSMPSSIARARTSIGSPRITRSAMPRLSTVAAARSTRSSSPSGSTIRRRSARARSMSSYSNMSGVTTVERARPEQTGQLLGVDVPLEVRQRGVVAPLRVGGEAPAGVHDPHRGLVRAEVGRDDRQRRAEAVDEAVDLVGERERTVEHDAGERGERSGRVGEERREQHLGAVRRAPRRSRSR